MASFYRVLSASIAMTFCLGGCASIFQPDPPEVQAAERAQARMDALMARDMELAFTFVAPSLRETTTWQRHGSNYAGVINWRKAQVQSASCQAEKCDVKIAITYQLPRPKVENTRSFDEVWIEVGGKWYLYDR